MHVWVVKHTQFEGRELLLHGGIVDVVEMDLEIVNERLALVSECLSTAHIGER